MPHPSPIPRPRAALGFALLLTALATLVACAGEPEAPEAEIVVDRYTVRGQVSQLPSPDRPGSDLQIRHEPVPDYRDDRGEVVGMDTMTMPFPVGDPTLLEGVAVGDKIEFDFEMAWEGSPPIRVTRIDVLDPSTELTFGKVKRDGDHAGHGMAEHGTEGHGMDHGQGDGDHGHGVGDDHDAAGHGDHDMAGHGDQAHGGGDAPPQGDG
ncbi:MAG: copper-binding protein [Acidobacteriota bacterium]